MSRRSRHRFRLAAALAAALGATTGLLAQPAGGRAASPQVSLTVEGGLTGNTAFEARGAPAGGIAVQQYGARLSVPLAPLAGQWRPTVSLRYRHHQLDRDPGTPLPEEFQSLNLSLGVFGPLSPDWSLFASVSPGYGNAGGGFTSRGLGVGVLAVATRKFNADFSGGFGLRYDSLARGSTRILPVATFDWTPAPGWRAFVGFPRTGASWRASELLTLEFVAEMDFGTYYVTDDPLPLGAGKPPLNRTRLEYQAVRVGPALAWRAADGFQVRLAAGVVPVLNAEYEQRNYKLKSDDTAAFGSLELEWRF